MDDVQKEWRNLRTAAVSDFEKKKRNAKRAWKRKPSEKGRKKTGVMKNNRR